MQGCVQRVLFGDVNAATVRVLAAEGWEVHTMPKPRCCGALQLHSGVEDEGIELAKQTIDAYEGFEWIVANVAGCGSAMKEYGVLLSGDDAWRERAKRFSAKVLDVTELLAAHEPRAPRGEIRLHAAYHDACHLAHAQGVRAEPRTLLTGIPGVELAEPREWELCCGSAGIYNVMQPEAAAVLGRRKAANLAETGAEAVVAANPGCAMQIDAHQEGDRPMPVLHPMTLLDISIRRGKENMSRITTSPSPEGSEEVLSREALEFLAELHGRFGARRTELLEARVGRNAPPGFDPATVEVRADASWRVVEPAADFADRRVEITGPTDRKLVINALNSGARGFMADFEDANSPTWRNQVEGQLNLRDAIDGSISYESPDGRRYELVEVPATLLVRPRGLHLDEANARIGEEPIAGSLFDFGLFVLHCGRLLVDRGSRPNLYLPKLEHHLEARWWNEVISFSEETVGLEHGTVRATVLIETLPAAFQMEEILFELRDHSAGLNAGRWDYIFSTIKAFRDRPGFVLPDRAR